MAPATNKKLSSRGCAILLSTVHRAERRGRRQEAEAGGRRQEAGGRRQEARGREGIQFADGKEFFLFEGMRSSTR